MFRTFWKWSKKNRDLSKWFEQNVIIFKNAMIGRTLCGFFKYYFFLHNSYYSLKSLILLCFIMKPKMSKTSEQIFPNPRILSKHFTKKTQVPSSRILNYCASMIGMLKITIGKIYLTKFIWQNYFTHDN